MNADSPLTPTDEFDPVIDLLQRAKAGEQRALIEILERYRPMLESAIRRKLAREHNGHDVGWEDCLNEAGMKVALKITQFEYRGRNSLQAWLIRVALNATEDVERVERKTPGAIPLNADGEPIDLPEPDPRSGGSVAGDNEIIRFVREELARDRIPAEYKEVLHLRFFEDLSGLELAAALGCNYGAARQTLHRAVQWVRDHLSQATKIAKAGRAMEWKVDDNRRDE